MTRLVAGAAGPPAEPYDVDIIILALERAEETVDAIASASAQRGVLAHIFVLDQGSCAATLERFARTVQGRRDVTLLATERNLGVAGGRNLLSALGHGRVIVALDNDAEFAGSDTVARMITALDADPRAGVIGCRIVSYSDGNDDLSSWGYPAALLPRAADSFDAVTYVGAGHAILRETWRQAGGYDAKLFFCWEEFDFSLRAIALGWRIRYRGDIVVRHKVCPRQRVGWTTARWFYFVRNRIYIARKLDQGWVELLPRIAGYLIKGTRNGLPVQTLRAIRAAIAMSPHATRATSPHAARAMPPHATDATSPHATRVMPPAGLSYLIRNDRLHRGSLWHRLTHEVLSRIGAPPAAASPAKR